jgi:precorrin-4/cobalt-precorrin-4 C11-methyltransferase
MKENRAIFAGAGVQAPGNSDLITFKAMKALEKANLIIYAGSLVPKAVLCWKGKSTKTKSSAGGMKRDQIIETKKTYYNRGQKVVRLHTGGPLFVWCYF